MNNLVRIICGVLPLKRCVLLLAFSLIPSALFSNKLYFPQVVFGGGYTTTITIMNVGESDVSSPFEVYGRTGVLLKSVPISVPGEGSTRISLEDPGTSIVSSWGMLDAGAGKIQGVATFDFRSANGALITTAGVLGLEGANGFIIPVDVTANGIESNTGIAIANVDPSQSMTLAIQLMSESGSGSPSVTGYNAREVFLGPRSQVAELLTSFWPLPVGFRGTLVVAAYAGLRQDNSLVVTALTVKNGLLSALPAIPGTIACRGCWDY
jgi:hypothetical protein